MELMRETVENLDLEIDLKYSKNFFLTGKMGLFKWNFFGRSRKKKKLTESCNKGDSV